MSIDKLTQDAERNREAFDEVLPAYVSLKISGVARSLERGARSAWLDASGCVWCVFDDPAFIRSEDRTGSRSGICEDGTDERSGIGEDGTDARSGIGEGGHSLQTFWSMGDVMMPEECDVEWVAERIAREALLQLRKLGFHRRLQFRKIEGERHKGALFSKTLLGLR